MNKILALIILLCAAFGASAQSLKIIPCDAGEHYRFDQVSCDFELYNEADKAISLTNLKAGRAEDKLEATSISIPSKARVHLRVKLALNNGAGKVNHYFQAQSDEKGAPRYQFIARAFVETVLDDIHPVLNLGVVRDGQPASKSISLTSQEVPDIHILRVLAAPEYLDAKIDDGGRALSVHVRPGAAWGLHEDMIEIALSAHQQPKEHIRVQSNVQGAVVADQNPVDLGLMRQGSTTERLIRLTSKDGEQFRVGDISLNALDAKVEVAPCIGTDKGCKLLKFNLNPMQAVGEIKGQIIVDFPDFRKKLPIFVWGLLVKPETEVRTVGDESKSSTAEPQFPPVSALGDRTIGDALKKAVAPPEAEPATPPGRGPLLKWSVANEKGIYGYIVYRSDSESAPPKRINRQIITARAADDSTSAYRWRDESADAGKTYWYSIAMIYNDGHKQQLTGPQKVVAK